MVVDYDIRSSAASLISAGLGQLPVEEEAEWKGYDDEDTQLLGDLIDELSWDDLMHAVDRAAARLPEVAS